MSFRNFLRRNIVADDPQPELSTLDLLDLERSMADHPAGKRRRAVQPIRVAEAYPLGCDLCPPEARPAPESLEEALSEDDLLAVARGAGVVREFPDLDHPGWGRLLDALRVHDADAETARVRRLDAAADAALRCYRETENADLAMETFERLSAVA